MDLLDPVKHLRISQTRPPTRHKYNTPRERTHGVGRAVYNIIQFANRRGSDISQFAKIRGLVRRILPISGRPFGALTARIRPPRPRETSEDAFLMNTASHESSGAHLGHIFDIFPMADSGGFFGRPFEAVRGRERPFFPWHHQHHQCAGCGGGRRTGDAHILASGSVAMSGSGLGASSHSNCSDARGGSSWHPLGLVSGRSRT